MFDVPESKRNVLGKVEATVTVSLYGNETEHKVIKKSDGEYCESCENEAQSWCRNFECRLFLCKTCSKSHKTMLPPHTVLPMATIRQVSSSFFKMSKNCKQHPFESLVLFCGQHDKMICDSCQLESHQNCKPIISSIKAANGVKDGTAMSCLEIRMNDLNQVSEKMLSQIEEKQKTLKESQNKFKNRVSEFKHKLVDRLNKLEADIHTDIDSKYEQCNETLTTKRTSLHASATSMTSWKSDLKSLKQNTSEIHLFQSVKFIERETNETESEIRKLQKEPFPTITFLPSVLESKMDKMLLDLGTINIENLSVPMPELNIDQEGQYLVSGIASAKQYIWIKNQRRTLIKVDINGTIQSTIKTTFDPLDICANKEGDVYYTNGEKVHVVTLDGKEREINKKGIEGIAVDDRGDVYVAEKTSNNIHKLFNNNQKPGIVMIVDDGVYRPISLSFKKRNKRTVSFKQRSCVYQHL
ncbi:unnamed protein product [Mytilus coruscus]|uniref:B box-type domain-containing protein n=1 Tax=Mytilus coruscus TaxID=42192 RepID=A0A6J8DIR4_MYTCO|nr:unnamed protein product [Mytilus coruscus]